MPAVGDYVSPDQGRGDFLSIVEEVSYVHDIIRMFQDPGGLTDVRVHTEIARALGESALGATNSVSSTTTSLSTVGSATPIVPAKSSKVK